jgi:putative restriction endonuclease
MKGAVEVLDAFENIRRAQRAGIYWPHKPLLILLAMARVQRGEQRLVSFAAFDQPLKQLLAEFGPSSAAKSRHYPFWHLATYGRGALWELTGPREFLKRATGHTPGMTELRKHEVKGGFPLDGDEALRQQPVLLQAVASRVLDAYFPLTLHADIVASLSLDLDGPGEVREARLLAGIDTSTTRRRRDPYAAPGGRSRRQTSDIRRLAAHAREILDLLPAPEFLALNVTTCSRSRRAGPAP